MGGIRDRYSLPSRVPSFHGMDKEAPCCFPFVVVKHGLTHFNHFKVCNWRAFSTFIILSNHPQGLVWEHFYHSKKKSCTHYTATPTFLLPLPQSLARIDLSECYDHSVFVRHCTRFIRHILINSHESNSLPFHRWAETQKKIYIRSRSLWVAERGTHSPVLRLAHIKWCLCYTGLFLRRTWMT